MSNDLISREALKKDLKQYFTDGVLDGVSAKLVFNQILHDIDNAPTVTKDNRPNICLNCEHCCYSTVNSDGEVMIMCNLGAENCHNQRPQGKWITMSDRYGKYVCCDKCGYDRAENKSNYCPNCGAKMDGGEDGTA